MDTKAEKLEAETKAIEDRMSAIESRLLASDQEKMNSVTSQGNDATTYVPVGNRYDSDESRCLRAFGCKSPAQLIEVNTMHSRFKDVPLHLKQVVSSLKNDIDVCRMTQQIVNGEKLDRGDDNARPVHVKGMLESRFGSSVLAPRVKAFGTGVTGGGLEWVPTALSAQYIEEYELERKVAQIFRQQNMTTNPYQLTVQNNITKARIQAESGGLAGSNFGTAKINFDATKLTEFMPLSEELNEDSAPDILSVVRSEVVESQVRATEAAILNGDDTGTHFDFDTDAGGAELSEKAWKGLRRLAFDNSGNGSLIDFTAGAVDLTGLRNMRAAMGKFGVNIRELSWVLSTKVYNQFLSIPEVITAEKFGPMATILQGALAALDGIPIIISEYSRDDVSATGANTVGGPNTFSTCLLVNTRRFYFGVRRPIRVKAVMNPTPPADEWLVASWWRGDFKGHVQSGTEKSVILGHNIA